MLGLLDRNKMGDAQYRAFCRAINSTNLPESTAEQLRSVFLDITRTLDGKHTELAELTREHEAVLRRMERVKQSREQISKTNSELARELHELKQHEAASPKMKAIGSDVESESEPKVFDPLHRPYDAQSCIDVADDATLVDDIAATVVVGDTPVKSRADSTAQQTDQVSPRADANERSAQTGLLRMNAHTRKAIEEVAQAQSEQSSSSVFKAALTPIKRKRGRAVLSENTSPYKTPARPTKFQYGERASAKSPTLFALGKTSASRFNALSPSEHESLKHAQAELSRSLAWESLDEKGSTSDDECGGSDNPLDIDNQQLSMFEDEAPTSLQIA